MQQPTVTQPTFSNIMSSPVFQDPKTWKALAGLLGILIKNNKFLLILFPSYKGLLDKSFLAGVKTLCDKLATEL